MSQYVKIIAPPQENAFSIDDLAERLYVERGRLGAAETADQTELIRDYRRLFGMLSERTGELYSDPRLKYPEMTVLFRMAADGLKLSKLIYDELQPDAAASKPIPVITLRELIDCNIKQLDRLESQLWLLDGIDSSAESLHSVISELREAPFLSPGRFQKIARRFIIDVDRTCGDQFRDLHSDISIKKYLGRKEFLAEPAVYANGMEAARLIAWFSGRERLDQNERELFTIAAMLQDVGLLPLCEASGASSERLEQRQDELYQSHPAVGAALVSGISEYSIDLPYLIAQHHERLDGSGYPRQLCSRQILRRSRIMSLVTRFLELKHQRGLVARLTSGVRNLVDARHAAALQLHQESEQGEFDLELTASLIEGLGYRIGGRSDLQALNLELDTLHSVPAPSRAEAAKTQDFAVSSPLEIAKQLELSEPLQATDADASKLLSEPSEALQSQSSHVDELRVDEVEQSQTSTRNKRKSQSDIAASHNKRRRRGSARYSSYARRR